MAKEADNIRMGRGGWISTALDGLCMALPLVNEKRMKVIINGGGLNPEGLAVKVHEMVGHGLFIFNSTFPSSILMLT